MPIPWPRGRGLTVGIAALLVLTATPAAPAVPVTVPPAPPTAPAGPARVLTLITGDRVTVTGGVGAETVLSVTDPHGPVQHPRLLSDNGTSGQGPFRAGDNISTSVMTAWGDSCGHAGVVWADSDTSRISLYQGGELLGEDVNERIVTVGGLSPDPKPYRLVLEGSRNLPDRPYSTRTRTVWDFTSATTDPTRLTPLPLVQLDYAVDADLSGRAHRRTELTVTASHLKGAAGAGPIRTATVEVSYDDGATWHRTALRKSADGWTARLDAPGKARYASLRTTTKDTEGNGVGQTLIRACGLR
ncbi:hypothetical protein [Streptomyces tendae]